MADQNAFQRARAQRDEEIQNEINELYRNTGGRLTKGDVSNIVYYHRPWNYGVVGQSAYENYIQNAKNAYEAYNQSQVIPDEQVVGRLSNNAQLTQKEKNDMRSGDAARQLAVINAKLGRAEDKLLSGDNVYDATSGLTKEESALLNDLLAKSGMRNGTETESGLWEVKKEPMSAEKLREEAAARAEAQERLRLYHENRKNGIKGDVQSFAELGANIGDTIKALHGAPVLPRDLTKQYQALDERSKLAYDAYIARMDKLRDQLRADRDKDLALGEKEKDRALAYARLEEEKRRAKENAAVRREYYSNRTTNQKKEDYVFTDFDGSTKHLSNDVGRSRYVEALAAMKERGYFPEGMIPEDYKRILSDNDIRNFVNYGMFLIREKGYGPDMNDISTILNGKEVNQYTLYDKSNPKHAKLPEQANLLGGYVVNQPAASNISILNGNYGETQPQTQQATSQYDWGGLFNQKK